jgi:hypothetical protein
MKASWVAKVKVPDRNVFWVGNFEANGRTDAKRAARLFVSGILPLDTKILGIAPGRLELVLAGPVVPIDCIESAEVGS